MVDKCYLCQFFGLILFSNSKMIRFNRLQECVLLLVLFLLGSCSEYNQVRKKGTFEEKYEMAMALYHKKEYYKCTILFEDILARVRGRKEAEAVNFYYGMTQFHQKQYLISSHHFHGVYTNYPKSEYSEESRFMYANSLYHLTPNFYLDQSYTNDAIKAFQDYINFYPETSRLDLCNKKIDELRYKLERKDFTNAKILYRLSRYKASIISLQNFIIDFPGSYFTEEALYLKINAQYDLAINSLEIVIDDEEIIYLKKERLNKVINFYFDFIDKYQESEFSTDAERIYILAKAELEKMKNT